MTSCYPNWQSQNYTHMFDIPDLRGPLPKEVLCPGSLADIIDKTPELSAFNFILRRSGFLPRYNELQANFTLFLPSDAYIKDVNFIKNMDIGTAISIVRNCTVDNIITKDVIQENPYFEIITHNDPNNLSLQTISGITQICPHINFVKYNIRAKNGMIHIVDKLIVPDVII